MSKHRAVRALQAKQRDNVCEGQYDVARLREPPATRFRFFERLFYGNVNFIMLFAFKTACGGAAVGSRATAMGKVRA